MAYIYRYTDLADNIIKYVGIVWSKNRALRDRISEHESEDWCKVRRWKIEYITENINSRTDAEYFESHYISLYGTDKYFNVKKSGWGISEYVPNREKDWKEFVSEKRYAKKEKTKENFEISNLLAENDYYSKQLQRTIAVLNELIEENERLKNNETNESPSIIQDIVRFLENRVIHFNSYYSDDWKRKGKEYENVIREILQRYCKIEYYERHKSLKYLNAKTKQKYTPEIHASLSNEAKNVKSIPCIVQYFFHGEYVGQNIYPSIKSVSDCNGIDSHCVSECIHTDGAILHDKFGLLEVIDMENIEELQNNNENFYIVKRA